jgi:molecular chaperone DnaK (HSP70)
MSGKIGIDLGTYNSSGAVAFDREHIVMVQSRSGLTRYGTKNFPSFVLFDRNGLKQAVGQRAKDELSLNPRQVVWGVKRLVGLSYEKAKSVGELRRFQYEIEPGKGGTILIKVGPERYTPSHILELILREIKEDAENPEVNPQLRGLRFDEAVISVPAYFKAIRTGPIMDAARQAGFTSVSTIAEPTAAALRYGVNLREEGIFMAFDIGGGTLDVTLMQTVLAGDNYVTGEISTSGDEALGGIDMDQAILEHVIQVHGLGAFREDPRAMAMLKDDVERAKIRLSSKQQAIIELPDGKEIDLARDEMEQVLRPLLERCRGSIRTALQQSGLVAADIRRLVFVGGPTYMPCVRRIVREELRSLGATPGLLEEIDRIDRDSFPVSPMECVSQGAGLKAGQVAAPLTKVLAEGYGTCYQGYYEAIIRENSPYRVTGESGICHSNPNARFVPVDLVAKTPDTANSSASAVQYKYEHLGNFIIAVTPTGELPVVQIHLEVDDDKRLIARLVHSQTGHQVRYECLDQLTGQSIRLQEDTRPEVWGPEQRGKLQESYDSSSSSWTREMLDKCLRAARQALDLADHSTHPKAKRAGEAMRAVLAKLESSACPDPNNDGPFLANRIIELLNVLMQPDVKVITAEDFRKHMEELRKITG